jgi:phage repressor protein C with HTH and peptisase S24 domain
MITVDELKKLFKVGEDQELLSVLGKKSKGTVSKWRADGVPAIVEREALAILAKRGITPGSSAHEPRGEPDNVIRVPVYGVSASAGPGAYNHHEPVVDFMRIDRDFARVNLEGMTSGVVCVKVTGSSMEPTLYAGDYCVVATSEEGRITRSGSIYILRNDDALLVKRVHVEGKQFRIVGDNPAENPLNVVKTEMEEEGYHVVGRVMYCFKAL